MTIIYVIFIKEVISPKLSTSRKALYLFQKNLSKIVVNHILVDFSEVESISHAFASQYLMCKYECKKEVREINVPENIIQVIKSAQQEIESANQKTKNKKKYSARSTSISHNLTQKNINFSNI